jgi:SWI/SNF-related matrix-associated actin-dependent regulator of chromatin subfamily A3
MTGTPIQNSLEDLGALVKFIKVPVLEDLAIFRKQITVPVVANVLGRFANLRRLLEALCLRRTKALLDLPEPITDTQILNLSPEETTQYHDFGEFCKHSIDLAISGHSMKKANQHVIQAILGMRLFCNDGEHALVRRMNAHGLPSDPEEALSYLQTSAKSTCVQCGTDIMTMYQEDDSSSGRLTICQHLICGECLPAYEDDLNSSQEEGRTQCPLCGLRGESSTFVLRPGAVDDEHALVPNGRYPTKLLALLNNVKHQSTNDKW